jgi:3-hydroxyacyl-[acyl-carrier-protein] dehydratase
MTPVGRFAIAHDHPAMPGHFPGDPVVPAVLLLDHVLCLLERGAEGLTAKLLAPVRPGETIEVLADAEGSAFECRRGDVPVLRGRAAQ